MASKAEFSPLTVTLVAGGRSELLQASLRSLSRNLLSNFEIGPVFANIDPIFGRGAELARTEEVIRDFFPAAIIRSPEVAGFGAAVKWLWSRIETNWGLHLEDDWELEVSVSIDDLMRANVGDNSVIVPLTDLHSEKPHHAGPVRKVKTGFLGLKRKVVMAHGTSPRFLKGEFARQAASMMKPELDPEKQMDNGFNPELFALVRSNGARFLRRRDGSFIMRDLGRAWRAEQGIEKTAYSGKSEWKVVP